MTATISCTGEKGDASGNSQSEKSEDEI